MRQIKFSTKSTSLCLSLVLICCLGHAGALAGKPSSKPIELTNAGKAAFTKYQAMLKSLRQQLQPSIPKFEQDDAHLMFESLAEELGPELTKSEPDPVTWFMTCRDAEKGKWNEENKQQILNTYNNAKASLESMKAARPLLKQVDAYLSDTSRDDLLVTCALLHSVTPRKLAEYAQQSNKHRQRIDALLADPGFIKEMLVAGGAKAGRYGRALEILEAIQAKSERAKKGHCRRLALATALELAAPELTGHVGIDPVERYLFYERSFLDQELHPRFDQHTVWEYRHVINEPNTNEDMIWMRKMLWNYRPDFITAPEGYRSRYVGLMRTEFGHKRPEWDLNAGTTKFQQTIDRGGQCGPKAFFGRALSRSFGVPTWGARLRKHTAMSHWTPKGWTTILGVSWRNGYWVKDKPDSMRAILFKLDVMSREYPVAYMKSCRAQWIGDVLGEEKIDRMTSGTGGMWNALSLNLKRNLIHEKHPHPKAGRRAWEQDTYTREDARYPEQLMKAVITDQDRLISYTEKGEIIMPAAACISPRENTRKILFIAGRDGKILLHYKRYHLPEPFVYEVEVAKSGLYELMLEVVTVNRDQYFLMRVNGEQNQYFVPLPYTVGDWSMTKPIDVQLQSGVNRIELNRSVPNDFQKRGWSLAGPDIGGVTIKRLVLKPVSD